MPTSADHHLAVDEGDANDFLGAISLQKAAGAATGQAFAPRRGHQHPVVLGAPVLHSAAVITVLLRYEHHIDHTFLQATHYKDQGGVLTVHRGGEEVARFPAGSWDGVYRYERNRVRQPDGGERTAKGLEVELGESSGSTH